MSITQPTILIPTIPKEYVTVYLNGDMSVQSLSAVLINSNDVPTIWNSSGTAQSYTLTDSVLNDGVANAYGMFYGGSSGDVDVVVLASSVQEYNGNPLLAYEFSCGDYNKTSSTNSETGVTTTKYSETLFDRKYYTSFMASKPKLVIKNPAMSMNVPYWETSTGIMAGGTYNVFFDFPDNVAYSQTFITAITHGTTSKTATTNNFYTDNTSLKNAFVAAADQYTTITVYHRDGTEWT